MNTSPVGAAGTGVNKQPLPRVGRTVRYFLAALVVAAPLSVAVASPGAQAQDGTCQGRPATIVGPTEGAINTNGTTGDDVIVAPIGPYGTVQGLGGDDLICLVNGLQTTVPDPSVTVQAGAGDDSVVNEAALYSGILLVELGGGTDHYVGADYGERVYGAWVSDEPTLDTEPDVLETRGGNDWITSGSAGVTDADVIATGPGRDSVTYLGAAGGSLDNGPDPDILLLTDKWEGDLAVDNVTRRATIADRTVLTWTAVDTFSMRAARRGTISFVGSEAHESINIVNMGKDLAAPSRITTGGGDDSVGLQAYLPASVDLGAGDDSLSLAACHRAYVALDASAECLTTDGREISTALAGIESFLGSSLDGLTVHGTERADRVTISARYVLVRSGPGSDRVFAHGDRTAQVVGGRGADQLSAIGPQGGGVTLKGGWGGDVLRGSAGPDRLLGGPGRDTAYGKQGRDLCVAEVRNSCKLP
jgi:hypothetical protein